MENVNKKILWVSDFDLDRAPGGAQRSDKILIDYAKLHGRKIKKVNYETLPEDNHFQSFDLIISSNVTYIASKKPHVIDLISNHKNHVRIEHDSNEHVTDEIRNKLFSNCKKTFFLSEYHYSFFKELYGDIFKNVVINYDPIDSSQFFNKNIEREKKILYAGYMHEAKGSNFLFEQILRNPQQQFVIAGFTSHLIYDYLAKSLPNVEYLGKTDYERMPEIYNRYERMIYEPNVREPFCRSVAEASMCGIEIITSKQKRIGSLLEIESLGIEEFSKKCNESAKTFWQNI